VALIEVEYVEYTFSRIVHLMLTAAAIPVATLDGLAPGQLITGLDWGSGDNVMLGPAPNGEPPSPGQLAARAIVRIHHASVADRQRDPAADTVTQATVWLRISTVVTVTWDPRAQREVSAAALTVEARRVDVAGAPAQYFGPPLMLWRQDVPLGEEVLLRGARMLHAGGVVTMRFTTTGTDNLDVAPANRVLARGEHWLVRVSGQAFAELLHRRLMEALSPPPGGATLEKQPTAEWMEVPWGLDQFRWAAASNFTIEKEDACPSLFGDVDVSVDAAAALLLDVPDAAAELPPGRLPELRLTLWLNQDTSDWDVFRCWLGSGGIVTLLGLATNPVIGALAGLTSLIAMGQVARAETRSQIAGGPTPAPFRLVGQDDNGFYYETTMPVHAPSPDITGYEVSPDGFLIIGIQRVFPARHVPMLSPPPGPLPAAWDGGAVNCATSQWEPLYSITPITIADHAMIFGHLFAEVPAQIFDTTTVIPADRWILSQSHTGDRPPRPTLEIRPVGIAAADATAQIFLHSSAGLARYDVTPVPAPPTVPHTEVVAGRIRCALQEIERLRERGPDGAAELADALLALDQLRFQLARAWLATAAASHPHDVPAQLAAADNALATLRFLAEQGGAPARRLELAQLSHQVTSYLGFGAPNSSKAVPAAELARSLYMGLQGEDHRLEIAESWNAQAMIHHVISIHGQGVDPLAEQAEQRRTAAEAAAILAPITESLPNPAFDNAYLQRVAGVWGHLIGTLTFGSPDSQPSVQAADYGRTVYTHMTDHDHHIDIAGLWGALSLRHHEISFHPDCVDRPGEQTKQRRAAAQAMALLTPIAEALPDPDIGDHDLRRMADIFNRLTGLLAFGAPPSEDLQHLVHQAAAWRDRIHSLLNN
jgi:hypothetical protein